MGVIAGLAGSAAGAGFRSAGRTHFDLTDADVAELGEIRATAAALIAEKRAELEQLEAELAVLDEALEESVG